MNFKTNYIIPTAINLNWEQVSPTDTNGLDYHITPELVIRIEDLASGNNQLFIATQLLKADGYGEDFFKNSNDIVIEDIFRRDYLPAKTQERIQMYFKEGNITCFFKDAHIKYFEELFNKFGFMSSKVSVLYKGRAVDDIVELPPDEFKLIMEEFEQLNVQGTIDYRASKDELKEDYQKAYEQKVASTEKRSAQKFWNKLKGKETRKKAIIAVASTTLGVAGYIARRLLVSAGGWGIAAALVVGTVGVVLDMYGRQELSSLMNTLFLGRNDRGMF